jgi:hypothetical protein
MARQSPIPSLIVKIHWRSPRVPADAETLVMTAKEVILNEELVPIRRERIYELQFIMKPGWTNHPGHTTIRV